MPLFIGRLILAKSITNVKYYENIIYIYIIINRWEMNVIPNRIFCAIPVYSIKIIIILFEWSPVS